MKKVVVLSCHTHSLFWFRTDMMLTFRARGYEVVAVGNESEAEWSEKFAQNGIRYRQVTVARNGTNPFRDISVFYQYKKILREEAPDAVFAYQAKAIIYGGISARLLKIKAFYPLVAGVGSVFLSDGLKTRLIRLVMKAGYRISMKGAARVFFQNRDDVYVFIKHKLLSEDQVAMIHGSGVNLEKFTVQPLPPKTAFLCISRLIRDKGVGEYLQAAKKIKERYPAVRFLLVGPYDTNPSALKEEELQPYIDAGIVEYFGEQTDVRPYFLQTSVFVLPSYREGTPKTVLEAMACGRAVITTDAPGCRETVIDGKNGYLVPVKDVDALAEKMKLLIEDPTIIPSFADEGRKMAEELFDVRIVNQVICDTMNL